MVIVGSWGCMFYWCMFYVWENDVNNKTMSAYELADRIKRGEKWQIAKPELMMEDRQLLELAAKAAGFLNWTPMQSCLFIETGHSRGNTGFHWNPLTDDGDALRLAVKLKMSVSVWFDKTAVESDEAETVKEPHLDDPYAATRRAIVIAAAKIGESL